MKPLKPGFLAHKLYNREQPVSSGLFDALQARRKKRKRGAFWLIPALLMLLGVGGYTAFQLTNTSKTQGKVAQVDVAKSGVSEPKKEQNISAAKPSERLAESSLEKTESASEARIPSKSEDKSGEKSKSKPFAEAKNSARTEGLRTNSKNLRALGFRVSPPKTLVVDSSPNTTVVRENQNSLQRAISSPVVEEIQNPNDKETHTREGGSANLASDGQKQVEDLDLQPTVNYADSSNKASFDFSLLQTKSISPVPTVLPIPEVWLTFHEGEKPAPQIKRREIFISLGPLALFNKTQLYQEAVGIYNRGEGAEYTTQYAEPGIGLQAGITKRKQLSSQFALLSGLHTFFFWQVVSGTVRPSASSPVVYYENQQGGITSIPKPELGYTLRSTLWVPVAPELLVEYRLPNSRWGIAAGAYALALPQTFVSYQGAAVPYAPYKANSIVQPMAQFWLSSTRTRIAFTAKRIDGTNLLPHPQKNTSVGWLLSASLYYRVGW